MGVGDIVSGLVKTILNFFKVVIEVTNEILMIPMRLIATLPDAVKTAFFIFLLLMCFGILFYIWKTRKEIYEVYAR